MFVVAGCIAITVAASGHLRAAGQPPQSGVSPSGSQSARAVFDRYCVGCHNGQLRTAGLELDSVDTNNVSAHTEIFEKVVRKLRMGLMPPAGRPRPDQATYDGLASWLERELDRAAAARPHPGRTVTFHRLNRAEYHNATRDLLALDMDVTSLLPPDDHMFGLDNVGDALSITPALMERYMSAARKISRLAIGLKPPAPVIQTYRVASNMPQDGHFNPDLPLGSRGGMVVRSYFPTDGEYEVKVRLRRGGNDVILGLEEPHQLDIRLDGKRLKRFTVGGENRGQRSPATYDGNIPGDPSWEEYTHNADGILKLRFAVKAGDHQLSVSFIADFSEPDGVFRRATAGLSKGPSFNDIDALVRRPAVEHIAIGGPYMVAGPGETASRQRIFVCRPTQRTNEEACARKILTALTRRAYRRPVTEADVRIPLGFYRVARSQGTFDDGIQFALERILVDPAFLFRAVRDPASAAPNTPYQIDDLELASRVSFFLWSSIPDDELLDIAAKGRLREPATLERQVRRMLADPRSMALVDNFFGQWLELRAVRHLVPDRIQFPDFDENLREAFEKEMTLFLESQLREDRSVVDLLTASYTFVNGRLARHYQIPNIYGSEFRRVTLSDDRRVGILGRASILTATSYPTRTSPVLRGKWLLSNILGTPPPPPPPDVPGLRDTGENGKAASVRERLELHRKNPVCAACHAHMDPLGFALENFDAVGAWRTEDAGAPINASGAMPGGGKFEGPAGLRQLLLENREQFVRTVTEKLLAYALGRGLEYYDNPAIRTIVRQAQGSDYSWSSIILGIVKSVPFRMRNPSEGS